MKSGTIEDLQKIIVLVKSLDAEKPLFNKLSKRQRASPENFEEVSRYDLNLIVNNLAIAKLTFEAGGSPNVGNYDNLNEAWKKELPTLKRVLSENILFDIIGPKRVKEKFRRLTRQREKTKEVEK